MEIYLSYCSDDARHGSRLKEMLKPASRELGFGLWSYQDTKPGTRRQKEMDAHLAQSFLFVPLVSAPWLVDSRCNLELTGALEQLHAGRIEVVSVLLRPCGWDYSPLRNVQHLPADGSFIASSRNQDAALLEVAKGIVALAKSRLLK